MINNSTAIISTLFLLAACCDESTGDGCTVNEIKQIEELRAPHLVSEQDGVRLYWRKACRNCDPVYFTTPCGDVTYSTRERHGKTTKTVQHQVNGTGCVK